MDKSSQSINELNAIAGGDYWQDIINQYKAGTIDGYEAEARFSEQYCQRLRQSYKYVLNMPLRIKKDQRPKICEVDPVKKVTKYISRKTLIYKTNVEYGDYTMNHVLGCFHGCKYPCYAYLQKKRLGNITSYEDWCAPALVFYY